MTTLTRAKLALALIGVVFFAAGIRWEDARLRFVAIAFVAAAWLLRFVRPRPADGPPPGSPGDSEP